MDDEKIAIYFIPWSQSASYDVLPELFMQYEPEHDMVWLYQSFRTTDEVKLAGFGLSQLEFFIERIKASATQQ